MHEWCEMPYNKREKQLQQLLASKKVGKVENDDSDSDSESDCGADLKLHTKAVKKKRKTIKNNGSALAALLHDSDRDSDVPFDEAIYTKKVTNKKSIESIAGILAYNNRSTANNVDNLPLPIIDDFCCDLPPLQYDSDLDSDDEAIHRKKESNKKNIDRIGCNKSAGK